MDDEVSHKINELYRDIIYDPSLILSTKQIHDILYKVLIEKRIFGGTDVMRCTYNNLQRLCSETLIHDHSSQNTLMKLMCIHTYLHCTCSKDYTISEWDRIVNNLDEK